MADSRNSRRRGPRRRAIVFAAFLASCRGRGEVGALVHVDTLAGGITRVISDQPVDSGRLALVRERDIQPPELDPAELADPQALALADDGSLLVADRPPAVKVFAADGHFVRTIGRAGSGPGEFRSAYIAVAGDTLIVQDARNVRGTTYNWRDGTMLNERRTACCFFNSIGVDGARRAVVWTMARPPDTTLRQAQGFVRFALAGATADTVFVVGRQDVKPPPSWFIRDAQGRLSASMPVPLQPRMVYAVDPTGGFVTGWTGEYLLRASADGRDTTMLFGRSFSSRSVSAGEKRALVRQRIREMTEGQSDWDERMLRAAFDPSLIPDARPAWDAVWIDRTGRRWVKRSEADPATVRFDVFSPDGRWLDVAAVPASGWPETVYAPMAWGADRVAVLLDGTDGRPLVRVYRITRTR